MGIKMRIGMGYDVHKLVEGRKLIIGGTEIPYEKGLLGHSDADVLLHAIMDALLGAAALGDIGKHFPDTEGLVWPIEPLEANIDHHRYAEILTADTFKDDYKILNGEIRARGINIPPLVNAYMSLSPTMKMLGTAINHEFGEVEETGIFFAIDDIFEEKKRRHIESYTAVR